MINLCFLYYYIDDSSQITEMESVIDGENIIFETDHFSTYAIAEKISAISAVTDNQIPKNGKPAIWIILSIALVLLTGAGIAVWFFKFRKESSAN